MSWRRVKLSVSSVTQSLLLLYGCSVPGDCMEIGRTRSSVCPSPRHVAVKYSVLLCKKIRRLSTMRGEQSSLWASAIQE